MKNDANYAHFLEGKEEGLVPSSYHQHDPLKDSSIFHRIGFLYSHAETCPKLKQLLQEIYREFSNIDTSFPERLHIRLDNTYSHQLLKFTFYMLGYKISEKPTYKYFLVWKLTPN